MKTFAVAVFSVSVLTLAGLWFHHMVLAQATTASYVNPVVVRYRIDSSRSKFLVHADRTGLGWFKGKSHLLAVRDFSGEASLSLDVLNPASLEMTIKADSLEETRDVFTPEQKGIISKEINEIVLESAKFPEITFKSTDIKGDLKRQFIRRNNRGRSHASRRHPEHRDSGDRYGDRRYSSRRRHFQDRSEEL